MANPLIPQGNLNRALASVTVLSYPALNVTYGTLSERMVSIAPDDVASDYLATQAGAVQSGRLYQMYTISIGLLKSQPLSAAWEAQRLLNTNIGSITVNPDANTLGPYTFLNCVLSNVSELAFSGASPDYPIVLKGTYPINASLFA